MPWPAVIVHPNQPAFILQTEGRFESPEPRGRDWRRRVVGQLAGLGGARYVGDGRAQEEGVGVGAQRATASGYACVLACLYEAGRWMDGWMGGWTDGWMDGPETDGQDAGQWLVDV
jgi:hypothetical protein